MFNKILVFRNDRFGEFLLNIPAIRALKVSNPGCRLTLVVDPYVLALAQCIEGVDEVIGWKNCRHGFAEVFKFSKELKAKNFDLCVAPNPSKESHIISFLAGIPVRLGYDRKWGFLLNKKAKDKKALGEKHEVQYNLDLVRLVGATTQDLGLSLSLNNDIIISYIKGLGLGNRENLVAVHPWTSDLVKQWKPDRFRSLVEKLISELKLKIVIVGDKVEAARSRDLFSGIRENIIDLSGNTDLVQLAAVLKNSRLLISGDSGPVHLACCVGTPVLALFRNDLMGKTARRWGPWARNCAVIEKSSLDNISVEEVLNKTKEMLG
ncbi:MAG: glycosyltransferase family 9 protein [Candidatus Omnitrophica bacterium]|nr:glycosyltransferase family 9 protein [Candidatus Omnitrophota bacterium]